MALISIEEANAWADKSKLILGDLDNGLESSIADQVLNRVSQAYDVSGWLTTETTPTIIKKIIAMLYVAWYYERAYSEDGGENTYSERLFQQAEALISGIVAGSLTVSDSTPLATAPVSSGTASGEFGEPRFTMGQIW